MYNLASRKGSHQGAKMLIKREQGAKGNEKEAMKIAKREQGGPGEMNQLDQR